MDVKEILKRRRTEKELTLDDVARIVGVSPATISRWESGDIANMKRDKIVRLASALDISPAVIMGWDDPDQMASDSPEVLSLLEVARKSSPDDVRLATSMLRRLRAYADMLKKEES